MKILLVEDTHSVALLMVARLQNIGHEVIVAENGQQAVLRFAESAPDLIIMDVEMPIMNGFEATTAIREIEHRHQHAWTPIIFLTASDTLENLKMAIGAGGDDFLPKSAPEPVLIAKMTAMSRIAAMRKELATANEKLAWQATHDGLTGLINRRHMNHLIDNLWREPDADEQIGLLLIDVDNFKKFNDTYGHQAGDQCLVEVARAIATGVSTGKALVGAEPASRPAECFGARYGGEEFCIAFGHASPAHMTAIDNAMRASLAAAAIPHAQNGEIGVVTLSAGACLVSPRHTAIATSFLAADAALYQSKANGRNRTSMAIPG